MSGDLTGRPIKDTYKDLLQVSNSNIGVDETLRVVSDGEGTPTPLQLSDSKVKVDGDLDVSGNILGAPIAEVFGLLSQPQIMERKIFQQRNLIHLRR
jgi:hypothetical protein